MAGSCLEENLDHAKVTEIVNLLATMSAIAWYDEGYDEFMSARSDGMSVSESKLTWLVGVLVRSFVGKEDGNADWSGLGCIDGFIDSMVGWYEGLLLNDAEGIPVGAKDSVGDKVGSVDGFTDFVGDTLGSDEVGFIEGCELGSPDLDGDKLGVEESRDTEGDKVASTVGLAEGSAVVGFGVGPDVGVAVVGDKVGGGLGGCAATE
jgi:hypothetical protein